MQNVEWKERGKSSFDFNTATILFREGQGRKHSRYAAEGQRSSFYVL